MKPNEIKLGIVGCGGIAKAHKDAFLACNITISDYADPNLEAAQKLSDGEGKCFSDYRAMIDSGVVNVISICTPPYLHEEIACLALKNGIHVLCEKPFSQSLESSRRMSEAAERSSALLMPSFRHRFIPGIAAVKRILPQLGPSVVFNNIFCGPAFDMGGKWFSKKEVSGGGCIMDTSPHSLDLFRFLAGEIVDCQALIYSHQGLAVEDAGLISVKSENGTIGSLFSSWSTGVGNANLDILCQGGRIVFDYHKPTEVRYLKAGQSDWEFESVEKGNGFIAQVEHFIGAIEGRWKLEPSHIDGLRSTEAVMKAYQNN